MDRGRLAAQLYTLRDRTADAAGFRACLARLAEIGYAGVQLSAVAALGADLSPAAARASLDEVGLACVATHRPWASLLADPAGEVALHRALGCDYVAVGAVPADRFPYTPEGFEAFLAEAAPLARRLADAGLRFGVHHHAADFQAAPDGRRPFDVLTGAEATALCVEVDTYWVAEAGLDPAALLGACAGRIPVVHLKDRDRAGAMAAVGEGDLDWPNVLAAGEAGGVEWYVVEQDVCPRDPFDCLRSSFEFLRAARPAPLEFRLFGPAEPEYARAVELRRAVLRRPLGLDFGPQELAAEADQLHMGAFAGGLLSGVLTLAPAGRAARMRQVAVLPSARRQGIGKRLVAFAESEARRRGFAEIVLHARQSAVPFYLALGYDLEGEPFEEVGLPHRAMRKSIAARAVP